MKGKHIIQAVNLNNGESLDFQTLSKRLELSNLTDADMEAITGGCGGVSVCAVLSCDTMICRHDWCDAQCCDRLVCNSYHSCDRYDCNSDD